LELPVNEKRGMAGLAERQGWQGSKQAYSCLRRKALAADLAVPIFTKKNVKVGQPGVQ